MLCLKGSPKSTFPAEDVLRGADEIAEFLLGSPRERMKIYNLIRGQNLPVFRLGSSICARRTALIRWIEAQESRSSSHTEAASPELGVQGAPAKPNRRRPGRPAKSAPLECEGL
jgi:hypothetical protein